MPWFFMTEEREKFGERLSVNQCCESGFNGVPGSGSGSRRPKKPHKNRQKLGLFEVLDVIF
jgi:hypothetical protein